MKNKIMIFFALGLLAALIIQMCVFFSGIGIGMISCETNSMYPNLYCNCIIFQKAVTNVSQINLGDIISFRGLYDTKIMNVVHRVTEKGMTYVVTKGDNNSFDDGFTNYNQIMSKVVGSVCPPRFT